MNDTPVFSIIIPIYNTEKYLSRCVDSAIHQTFQDIEIILVNDGSSDACPILCDEYAKKDSRIKVIHKKNGGLSDARNAGIRAATGKYILFLDSDDYLQLNTCEQFLPASETDCDILIGKWFKEHNEQTLSPQNTSFVTWNAKAYLKYALKFGQMSMAAVLYLLNREFVEKCDLRFKYGIRHEDDEFTPRAFLAANTVIETNIAFYSYVFREDSITTQKDLRKNADDLWDTCIELEQIYHKLHDKHLAYLLLDTLVMELLSLFQDGRLYQYGSTYIHRKFVFCNAHKLRTRLKAVLFCFSPRLYWHINHLMKVRK